MENNIGTSIYAIMKTMVFAKSGMIFSNELCIVRGYFNSKIGGIEIYAIYQFDNSSGDLRKKYLLTKFEQLKKQRKKKPTRNTEKHLEKIWKK